MNLENFFKTEYISYGMYDSVRKIGSYIDGQKNASRKVLFTLMTQNISSMTKVSNLGPKVQDTAEYLHGSIEKVIVGMIQNYVGSGNNLPLLVGQGNLGTAFIPAASAPRYIYGKKSKWLELLFDKDDTPNLKHQIFEGSKIEPRFYVPKLPLIAINGSEGLAIGFTQKILPRDPLEVIEWIKCRSKGKPNCTLPAVKYRGMACNITQGDSPAQWVISGSIKRISATRIEITSIPVGIPLAKYLETLDFLVEKKVIKGYVDNSDDDIFNFVIKCTTEFASQSDDEILSKLKLVTRVTENFNCLDEDNKVREFESIEEVLEAWYQKRMEYNVYRKHRILERLKEELRISGIKREWINLVTSEKIVLNNRTEDVIVTDISNLDIDLHLREEIIKEIDMLMKMPIRSLTKEEMKKLYDKYQELEREIQSTEKLSTEEMLLNDIKIIEQAIKKETSWQ